MPATPAAHQATEHVAYRAAAEDVHPDQVQVGDCISWYQLDRGQVHARKGVVDEVTEWDLHVTDVTDPLDGHRSRLDHILVRGSTAMSTLTRHPRVA